MIRITGGRFKGRRIAVAASVGTRPSSGRLREALFSAVGRRIVGASFADLFAGSGALGIEALSRGASGGVFVELDPRAIRVLRANLDELGVPKADTRIRRADAWRWLEKLETGRLPAEERPEVLLIDPPYAEGVVPRLLPPICRLLESGAVGLCALEHASAADEIGPVPPAIRLRTRRHGRSSFSLLERSTP